MTSPNSIRLLLAVYLSACMNSASANIYHPRLGFMNFGDYSEIAQNLSNRSIDENNPVDFLEADHRNEIAAFDPTLTLQHPISYSPPDPIYQAPRKNATLAAGLSVLFPGLGHAYLGDMKTAGSLAGGASLAYSAAVLGRDKEESIYISGAYTLQNTWAYGIYAAYRDARIANGQSSYSYKMPTENFTDLATAPFRPSILKKPEVWGGILGALTAAFSLGYLKYQNQKNAAHFAQPSFSASGRIVKPFMALPLGIGEEALFRGYLQPQLSEAFNPTAGIFLSSLAFGAAHLVNTEGMNKKETRDYCTYSIPFITTFGIYFGWLAHKNSSLKETVAIHTLYDFVLFSIGALAGEASASKDHGFTISIPF